MRLALSLVCAGLLFPLSVQAQTAPATSSGGVTITGPRSNAGAGNTTPARQPERGRQSIARAQAAFIARDYDTALAAFREAQTERDFRIEALLGVGATLTARNDREGALDALREAVAQSISANSELNRVRAMQAIANLHEATGHWPDALAAWRDFINFAESHSTIASAENGRARVAAIQAREDRERQDSQVRTRIETRQRLNAATPPATPPSQ